MAKKKTNTPAPTLNNNYNQVAAMADTQGVKINAAETERALACFVDVVEDYQPADAFDFVAKGLQRAGDWRR